MAEQSDLSKLVKQIKKSNNVLIAVNSNPSIDELATALGLTLMLNKNKRRAVSIFSGEIPNVLKFLKPEETFDKNVDGLRDFIITLDPDKADRVVCKVEDGVVKVFITPNNTIIKKDDLGFEQGDYNIDLIIALGVKNKDDLDKALSAHGRILNSAFVAALSVGKDSTDLGALNIVKPELNSYAELIADLPPLLDQDEEDEKYEMSMDESIATALLTALVSTTNRFSNHKTTAEIMNLAADLMKVGADQQRIVAELDKQVEVKTDDDDQEPTSSPKVDDAKVNETEQTLDLAKTKPEIKSTPTPESTPLKVEPVKSDLKIKPDFSNIDEYTEAKQAKEQQQMVKAVLDKVDDIQGQSTVKQPVSSDTESDQLAQQLEAVAPAPQPIEPPVREYLSLEEAAGQEVNAPVAPSVNVNAVPVSASPPTSTPVMPTVPEQLVVPPPTVPPFDITQSGLSEPGFDPLMPPPLPDFSSANAQSLPMPPEMGPTPLAEASQTVVPVAPEPVPVQPQPQSQQPQVAPNINPTPEPEPLAQPILTNTVVPSEDNPFSQFTTELAQQNQAASTQPAPYQPMANATTVQIGATNPVMQDQVYPQAPADKAQFIIPE